MRKLLISFVFTLLTAQSAYALANKSEVDHSIKLIQSFEASKVDAVINSSIGEFTCGEGLNVAASNEEDQVDVRGPGRAPAIIAGKSKFELFKEAVEKGEFREDFYKEGDVYSYSSRVKKVGPYMGFLEMTSFEHEHVFKRKSETEELPFEHELGLTSKGVKRAILDLLDKAEETYQTDEKAFSIRVGQKAYHIDLKLPLLANPVYKQDITTGNIEYGFTNVTPRISKEEIPFVSMSE